MTNAGAKQLLWVIDSSSLIKVRELVSRAGEKVVWDGLTALVKSKRLCWPREVSEEVERGRPDDSAARWMKLNRQHGERSPSFDTVKAVIARAPGLVDADATKDQADPYVIALALESEDMLCEPRLVTEDRADKPLIKLSLATAAGMHGLAHVPLHAFLQLENLRPQR